ncbi:MAG: riboflavin biosynthesis protein RibF [Bacteroidetes bacterium MedPE-SWsnd-G2]|nr:MAG: riboflavin biosynthesis protein RibF [Bacteroidetes bacterium MedPE-SWsnd-G2]
MNVYNSSNPYPKTPSVITIGTFDGVHIGHQKIIKRLNRVAKEKNLSSLILTFFPHPRMVLQSESSIKLLNTITEKQEVLSQFGLESLYVMPFTADFANMSARDYVKTVLVDLLNAKHVIIGYDHKFGKGRTADFETLKTYGQEFGFDVEEISVKDLENVAVSSTKIRRALDSGEIQTANSYLGYPFFITGEVIKGKSIGQTIGYPTANIFIPENYKLIPKQGVYVVSTVIDGKPIYGMMNIGNNPTVNGTKQSIEVHLFDLNQDLYSKVLKLNFLHHLRNEQKFDSLDKLKQQLHQDKIDSLAFIATLNE